MGRSLGPVLREELENLDKDADSRRSAMKALKSYVKDLDSKAIPFFLAQVCETKKTSLSSGEHTISLYEVLARVHGPKIVPQIDSIMNSIVNSLSSSGGAFALSQACSKVVPAIARYAIDPTTAEDRKRYVIHSLCKPLSECLLGSQENLSCGAALCLQALVESDNWRYASNDMINEVCQRVAGALEKYSHTNCHLALITSLAKHNSLTVEAYSRLLINSGLRILEAGFAEANSQKQFSAINMVSSLMRCLDPKSLGSELELVIEEMEKCQSDRMPPVTGAAFEALQIAKRISADKGLKAERESGSATGSNFDRRENTRRSFSTSPDQSHSQSPESQTVDSAAHYDCFVESPNSMNQGYQNLLSDRRSVNRKHWRRYENGVDVSLKDGICSDITRVCELMNSDNDHICHTHGDYLENFAGFIQNGTIRTNTPSPDLSNSHVTIDNLKIFSTPRRLIQSLQDPDNCDLCSSKKETRNSQAQNRRPKFVHEQDELHGDMHTDRRDTLSSGKRCHCSSESISSTGDVYNDEDPSFTAEVVHGNDAQFLSSVAKKNHNNFTRTVVYGLFVLFAVLLYLWVTCDRDARDILLVPT